MEDTDNADTVALRYADMDNLADELGKQVLLMRSDLDQLQVGWNQMLATTSGLAMSAFSHSAGEWMAQMRAQVAVLEAARDWLRRHAENMREAEQRCARRVTSK